MPLYKVSTKKNNPTPGAGADNNFCRYSKKIVVMTKTELWIEQFFVDRAKRYQSLGVPNFLHRAGEQASFSVKIRVK